MHSQYEGQYDFPDDNIDQYEGRASIDTVDNDGLFDSPSQSLHLGRASDVSEAESTAPRHTRKVLKGLHKAFRSKETVVFQDIARASIERGPERAANTARFFHEVLLLKTKGCIDVRQDEHNGPIRMVKADRFDNFYADVGLA